MHYSASKASARLNWLDRLRSAKGFPVEPGLKIEDFLNSNASQVQSPALPCGHSLDVRKTRTTSEKYQQNGDLPKAILDESEDRLGASSLACTMGRKNDASSLCDEVKNENDVKVEEGYSLVDSGYCANGGSLNVGLVNDERDKVRSSVKPSKRKKSKTLPIVREEDWFEITNNALAELFGMRDAYQIRKFNDKKHKRKQEKPRICPSFANPDTNLTSPSLVSTDDNSVENPGACLKSSSSLSGEDIFISSPLSADDNMVVGMEKKDKQNKFGEIARIEADESPVKKRRKEKIGHKEDVDCSPYSCTEVTLIDTSIPAWKTHKVIYRKGTIWKVRDKKASGLSKKSVCGSSTLDVRKRKSVGCFDELHFKKKGPRSSCSPNLRVREYNGGECSPIKVRTRRKLHSDYSYSSKDTGVHSEKGNEFEEQNDNIPQARFRHSKKTHLCSGSTDCSEDGDPVEVRQQTMEATSEAAPHNNLSPDHPVNQPIETLPFSIYQVFLQAGRTGLTAREAVSRILERGLPGLHEGGVVPRVEVAKILRTSPYFMQLEESKFVLCSAIIGNEGQQFCSPVKLLEARDKVAEEEIHEESESGGKANQSESWQYWAALAAIRRVRTRRRSLTLSQSTVSPCLSKESVGGEGEVPCS
eukprot:Gb_27589 [translate_table: standard]